MKKENQTKTLPKRKLNYLQKLGLIEYPFGKDGIIFSFHRKKVYLSPELIESSPARFWVDEEGEKHKSGGWIQFKTFKKIVESMLKEN